MSLFFSLLPLRLCETAMKWFSYNLVKRSYSKLFLSLFPLQVQMKTCFSHDQLTMTLSYQNCTKVAMFIRKATLYFISCNLAKLLWLCTETFASVLKTNIEFLALQNICVFIENSSSQDHHKTGHWQFSGCHISNTVFNKSFSVELDDL